MGDLGKTSKLTCHEQTEIYAKNKHTFMLRILDNTVIISNSLTTETNNTDSVTNSTVSNIKHNMKLKEIMVRNDFSRLQSEKLYHVK